MPAGYIRFNVPGGHQVANDVAQTLCTHLQQNWETTLTAAQMYVGTNQRGGACIDVAENCPKACIDEITAILDVMDIKPLYWRNKQPAQQPTQSGAAVTAAQNAVVNQLNQILPQPIAQSHPPVQTPAMPPIPPGHIQQMPPTVPTTPPRSSAVRSTASTPQHAVSSTSPVPVTGRSQKPMLVTFETYDIEGATSGLVDKLTNQWKLPEGAITAAGPGQIEVSATHKGFYGIRVDREAKKLQSQLQFEKDALTQLGDYGESYDMAKKRIDQECGINKKVHKSEHEEIKNDLKSLYTGGKPKNVRFADEYAVMKKFDALHGRGDQSGKHLKNLLERRNEAEQSTGQGR